MMNNETRTIEKIVFYNKLVSGIGSGFSQVAMPLFVFAVSKDIFHVGMQWALYAGTRLLATFLVPRIKIAKNDRDSLIVIEFLLALAALTPIIFYESYPVFGAYLTTFLLNLLIPFHMGYMSSLIGHYSTLENRGEHLRQLLLTLARKGENLGILLGMGGAGLVIHFLTYKFAFVFDSLTFLFAGVVLFYLREKSSQAHFKKSKASFSLAFSASLIYLSIAQMLASFAVYILNGSYVVILKKYYQVSDFFINGLLVSQFVLTFLAATLIERVIRRDSEIKDSHPFICRVLFIPIFSFMAISTSGLAFSVFYLALMFVIAYSLPIVQAMFHREVTQEDLRGADAARISLTSVTGGLGAVFASLYLNNQASNYANLYYLAAIFSVGGALFFWLHVKRASIEANLKTNP